MPIEPVDLLHLGNERVIGVYVVETPEGPALFDCGPATCFERLQQAVDLSEIKHLLLSHIHLDHAGAAGHVVRATSSTASSSDPTRKEIMPPKSRICRAAIPWPGCVGRPG